LRHIDPATSTRNGFRDGRDGDTESQFVGLERNIVGYFFGKEHRERFGRNAGRRMRVCLVDVQRCVRVWCRRKVVLIQRYIGCLSMSVGMKVSMVFRVLGLRNESLDNSHPSSTIFNPNILPQQRLDLLMKHPVDL
jgi:hypothetical protein